MKSYQEIMDAAEVANDSVRWWQKKLIKKELELFKVFRGGRATDFEKCLADYEYLAQRADFEDRNITKLQKEIDNYGAEEEF